MLEQIDIGGVALLRAGAKNFQDVVVLARPEDYVPVMQEWREQGEISTGTRRRLAAIAFQECACYDSSVAGYLRGESGEHFPEELTLALERSIRCATAKIPISRPRSTDRRVFPLQ